MDLEEKHIITVELETGQGNLFRKVVLIVFPQYPIRDISLSLIYRTA